MIERFPLTVDGHLVQPHFPAGIGRFQDVEQTEAIKRRAIGLVSGIEMANRSLVVQRDRDASCAAVAARIIAQRPPMRLGAAGEAFQPAPARGRVADLSESPGVITTRPPAAGGVFDEGVKDIAAALKPERDGIRRAPFVERTGVEKADEDMKLTSRADQSARCAQGIVEGPLWNGFRVIGRLGRGCDQAADFPRRASGVPGGGVPEVLPDRPRLR